jgi:hypothetical protein
MTDPFDANNSPLNKRPISIESFTARSRNMGRSSRSALNCGDMPEWEEKLREALGLIGGVCASIYECLKDEDQYDNAADGIKTELTEEEL